MATTIQTNIDITENHICLRYMEAVRKECQYIDFLETGVMDREVSISSPTSSDVYVTPYFSEDYIDAHRMNDGKLPDNVLNLFDLADSEKYKHLFLKGDPGIGKTTLLRRVAYTLCEPVMGRGFRNKMGEKLPILAILRDISLKDLRTFDDFLDRIFEQSYLKNSNFSWNKESKKLFEKLLKQGQIIFLLDGLDEITDNLQRDNIASIIQGGTFKYQKCSFWCTTRLTGFNQTEFWHNRLGMEEALDGIHLLSTKIKRASVIGNNYKKTLIKKNATDFFSNIEETEIAFNHKYNFSNFSIRVKKDHSIELESNTQFFKEIYLTPFDNEQIKKFMQQWSNWNLKAQYEANGFGERFLQSLLINTSVLHLARIPNMLTMMAMYYRVNERFPDGRYELYDKIVHSYLEIVDSKRKMEQQHRIETKHLRRCLAYLAYEMQKQRAENNENELSVSLEESKAKECFLKILKEEEANKSDAELKEQIEEFFNAIKKRSALLVERSAGNFAFLHLSMQEFLCAEYLQRLWYKALRKRKLEEHWSELQTYANKTAWLEVILLYFEAFRAIKEREKEDFEEAFTKLCYEDETIKAHKLCGHLMADEYLSDFIENKVKDDILGELVFITIIAYEDMPHTYFPNNWLANHPYFWDVKLNTNDISLIKWAKIKDLSDIEYLSEAYSIEVIVMSELNISDEVFNSLLHHKSNIKYLNFSNNQVSDISILAKLTNLTGLYFWNNQVSDISILAKLTNLTDLYFHNNQVSDINSLAKLTNLTGLSFDNNQVSDISSLVKLTNLTDLSFSNNQVSDISILAKLTNLTDLSFPNNQVSDISILAKLTNLTGLYFSNNQVSDISSLAKLTNLTGLYFFTNQVSDISILAKLTNLTGLDFDNNQVSDISSLTKLNNLTDLYFHNNQVSDINSLANLTNLTILYFSDNPITDYTPIKEIYKKLENKDFTVPEWEEIKETAKEE